MEWYLILTPELFDAIDKLPAGFYFIPMTEISWVVIEDIKN